MQKAGGCETVRAKGPEILRKCSRPIPPKMFCMSNVMCHVSQVTLFNIINVFFFNYEYCFTKTRAEPGGALQTACD